MWTKGTQADLADQTLSTIFDLVVGVKTGDVGGDYEVWVLAAVRLACSGVLVRRVNFAGGGLNGGMCRERGKE